MKTLMAPLIILVGMYLAQTSVHWAPYAGVALGYLSGVLATFRYDLVGVEIVKESDPAVMNSSALVDATPKR